MAPRPLRTGGPSWKPAGGRPGLCGGHRGPLPSQRPRVLGGQGRTRRASPLYPAAAGASQCLGQAEPETQLGVVPAPTRGRVSLRRGGSISGAWGQDCPPQQGVHQDVSGRCPCGTKLGTAAIYPCRPPPSQECHCYRGCIRVRNGRWWWWRRRPWRRPWSWSWSWLWWQGWSWGCCAGGCSGSCFGARACPLGSTCRA